MRTILSVIGARPQFIKHAPVQRQLREHFRALTVHTGQHFDTDMSAAFFEELAIPAPDFTLKYQPSRGHGEQTGRMMGEIEAVCQSVRPDAVLIYGDTNTTLAGALVATKMQIPLFHVEAGIRGFNRALPEEVNRVIADTFSTLLFCPTQEAVDNLRGEGIAHQGVHLTGDVMCDTLEVLRPELIAPQDGEYYYATIHRPYNTDDPGRLRQILDALNALGAPVYFPLHPRTASQLKNAGVDLSEYPNIRFSGPVNYRTSLSYQLGAACVITDSSGVQKEAYMLRRKCVTLRSETEWNDTLKHGWNTLVFDDLSQLQPAIRGEVGHYEADLFGNGKAASNVVQVIREYFEGRKA